MAHHQLTTFDHDPILDLDPWVGQRQATFRFQLINGTTGLNLREIHPIRNAQLSHDTSRTIKRQLSLSLGVEDTATINVVSDRILVYMTFPNGTEYPLGRYMFTDASREVFAGVAPGVHTGGGLGNVTLNDEMFLVDQQIERGILGSGRSITEVILEIMNELPVDLKLTSSPFSSSENWGIGTGRGQVLESLSVSGDYFSPWFGNDGAMHFIRAFDPASQVPDFDWDHGNKVSRESIIETDDLLTAPNRFIVISNAADDPENEVVGIADTPSTAPHSIINRGFVIPEVQDLQLASASQAQAVAEGIAQRMTVFERISATTAPDPRHDSYNVIRWRGEQWLELAWTLDMANGGMMSHLLRKAYTP